MTQIIPLNNFGIPMFVLTLFTLFAGRSVCQDIETSRTTVKASRNGYDLKLPKEDEEIDSGPGFQIALPGQSPLWRLYGRYGDCREYLIFQGQPAGKGPESVFGISPFNNLLATHWQSANTLIAYYHIDGMYGRAGLKSNASGSDTVPLGLHDCLRAKIQISPDGNLSIEQKTFSFQGKWLVIGDVVESSPGAHKKLATRRDALRTGPGIYCNSWNTSKVKGEHQTLAFAGLTPNKAYLLLGVEPTKALAEATLKRLKASKVQAYLKKVK